MHFEAEAYIDEYVIDGEHVGTFAGNDINITYTPDDTDTWPSVSIPTDDITNITFERNTSLHRNRLLGWFFAGITVLLILLVYVESFAGQHTDPSVDLITVFFLFLIVGGISTTYEYFNGENHDVIVIYIRTDDDELHVFNGRVKDTDFVEACSELIESDIETRNQNKKLESELSS